MHDQKNRMRRRRDGGDSLINWRAFSRKDASRLVMFVAVVVLLSVVARLSLEAADPAVVEYRHDVTGKCLGTHYFHRDTGVTTREKCGFESEVWYEYTHVQKTPELPPLPQPE